MIIKDSTLKRSNASSIEHLTNYLLHGKQGVITEHRVAHTFTKNLESTELDEDLFREFNFILKSNTRTKSDKILHLIVSLKPGETLAKEDWELVASTIAQKLDLIKHQFFGVLHKDTDSEHLHLVFNLIDPISLNKNTLAFAHYKLSAVAAELESKFHLNQTNHAARKTQAQRDAEKIEHQTGQQSFLTYVKSFQEKFLRVKNWQELHEVLSTYDLQLERKGQGLTIRTKTVPVFTVKASSVNPALSFGKLQQRFGPYQQYFSQVSAQQSYEQVPCGFNHPALEEELFADYKKYRSLMFNQKNSMLKKLYQQHQAEQSRFTQLLHEIKTTVNRIYKDQITRQAEYKHLSAMLSAKKKAVAKEFKKQKQDLEKTYTPVSFLDYLIAQGDSKSRTLLLTKTGAKAQTGNILFGKNQILTLSQFNLQIYAARKITKKGMHLYLSDILKNDAIKEDGSKIIVSKNPSLLTIRDALTLANYKIQHRPIKIEGDFDYQYKVAIMAAQMGIAVQLQNPNLQKLYLKELFKYERFRQFTGKQNRGVKEVRNEDYFRQLIFCERLTDIRSIKSLQRFSYSVTNSDRVNSGKLQSHSSKLQVPTVSERNLAANEQSSTVFLSDYANHRLGEQQLQTVLDQMRRNVYQSKSRSAELIAIENYIAERNAKYQQGFKDVLEHALFQSEKGDFKFKGLRNFAGVKYGLFEQNEKIYIKALTDYNLKRLKALKIDTPVKILANGTLEVKAKKATRRR